MAFMLQARWHITKGRIDEFRANQEIICAAMSGHPGVITYHVDYPEPDVSEWIEIYANDEVFRAHLENAAGKAPLAACRGLPRPATASIAAASAIRTRRPVRSSRGSG
jgi:quinol monooxygenase YgiN